MKIYINNFNLDILNNITNKLKENLVNSKKYIQLYTDEGIFMIDNKMIHKLNPKDIPIITYNNYYEEFTLIVDPSYFVKENVTSVHGTIYLSFETKKNYYKINNKSTLSLVIENYYEKNNFIPNDIYFELEKEIDLNNIFIKKEIIEFLSVLN
jgi:hypothetical protein